MRVRSSPAAGATAAGAGVTAGAGGAAAGRAVGVTAAAAAGLTVPARIPLNSRTRSGAGAADIAGADLTRCAAAAAAATAAAVTAAWLDVAAELAADGAAITTAGVGTGTGVGGVFGAAIAAAACALDAGAVSISPRSWRREKAVSPPFERTWACSIQFSCSIRPFRPNVLLMLSTSPADQPAISP